MKSAAEILEKAADLIETRAWCKHATARDGTGQACKPRDPQARMFCMLGALERVAAPSFDGWIEAQDELAARLGIPIYRLGNWNDSNGRNAVVALLRGTAKRMNA